MMHPLLVKQSNLLKQPNTILYRFCVYLCRPTSVSSYSLFFTGIMVLNGNFILIYILLQLSFAEYNFGKEVPKVRRFSEYQNRDLDKINISKQTVFIGLCKDMIPRSSRRKVLAPISFLQRLCTPLK